MGPFTMRRFTIWLARAGLLVIAMVTFVTSFDAITATAAATGAVSPRLAWAVPIAIDGLILVGSAVAWTEAIDDDWHPFPLLTVGGAAGLSVWANVAHAAGAPVLGQVLAAVPPIALIVSVELGAWQVRRSLKRTRQEQEEREREERELEALAKAAAAAELERQAAADADAVDVSREDEAAVAWDGVDDQGEQPSEDGAYADLEQEWEPRPSVRRDRHEWDRQVDARLTPAFTSQPVSEPARTEPVRTPAAADARIPVPAAATTLESDSALMERIADYVTELGHRPTQKEIAEALGLSRSSVRRAINAQPEVWHRLGRLAAAGNNGQGVSAAR